MAKKSGGAKKRVAVANLPTTDRKLSRREMKGVKGGGVIWGSSPKAEVGEEKKNNPGVITTRHGQSSGGKPPFPT